MQSAYASDTVIMSGEQPAAVSSVQPAQGGSQRSKASPFVRPPELEPDIAFWRRIYTEVGTDGGLLHDPENLAVVYEVLKLPRDLPSMQRVNLIDDAKAKYGRILRRLAENPASLTAEEERVRALWPKGTRGASFLFAADQVRFQLGQADRFREGLVRSGAWKEYIAETFEKQGLPRELSCLPHVESSFNTYAYSKVGAAGMWQFMRGTGRRFMRIDNVVDERLDPYRATPAAAQFLAQNYAVLGSWPLALTAYNHGASGMRRAKEQVGTDDIVTVVRKYQSKSFGFASRNFYVAFLAALEVDSNPEKFFGPIQRNPSDNSQVVTLSSYVSAQTLAKAFNVDRDELRRLNPSLLPSVWSGSRSVPRGYDFRVPPGIDLKAALARIPGKEQRNVQLADSQHRVRRGETLASIAKKYDLSSKELATLNRLKKPYKLKSGQRLKLPPPEDSVVLASQPTPPPPAVSPPAVMPSIEKPPAVAAVAPSKARPKAGEPNTYVVRRGDTLYSIAARKGMTEQGLMAVNRLTDRNFIYEGQVLALEPAAQPPAAVVPPPPAEIVAVPTTTVAEADETPARPSEPVTDDEAEEMGPTLVPGVQAASSADPADYSVGKNRMIRVEAAETVGHYAEWLNIDPARLRKLNKMKSGMPLAVGRSFRLEFARVSTAQFEAKRFAYHKQLQELFFTQFRIAGSERHVVKRGESIWQLAERRYSVPLWLLRQYNPEVDFASVRPGTRLVIPLLEKVGGGSEKAAS
jgi:membrane-bound lytic murein transglycosylase D